MDDIKALYEFWKQPQPDGNIPVEFVYETHRSKALYELIKNSKRNIRILEIGCNIGRNLNYLSEMGFTDLSGIEINQHAIDLMPKIYPNLNCTIHTGSAEDILPTFTDKQYDLAFTMAVIEHIHPDSCIFSHLSRITKQLILVEPTNHQSHRSYPHNIEKLFNVKQKVWQFDDYHAYICK